MPRRAAVIPNRSFHTTVPRDLLDRFDLVHFSAVEGCVPRGVYQEFLCRAIRESFEHRELDLAPYFNTLPGLHKVKGPLPTLLALERLLKGEPA